MKGDSKLAIHDLQASEPEVQLGLSRAGVQGIAKAIHLRWGKWEQVVSAEIDCTVDLAASQKGVHMSRFPELFEEAIERVVIGDGDRPDARRAHPLELLDRRLLDDAAVCRHHQVAALLEVWDGDHGQHPLPRLDLDALEVDDRDALRLAAGIGDLVHLRAEDAAPVREEECPVVRVGDQQVRDGVFLDRAGADDPLAAASLTAVGAKRLSLDVATARHGHDDVLVRDQVLVGEVPRRVVDDDCASLAGVLPLELYELVTDDRHDPGRVGEDVLKLGNELDDGEVLVLDLLTLEGGQAAQLHLQDRVRLDLGEREARHQVRSCGLDVRRLADRLDHRVQVVEGDLQPLEDVSAVARLLEVELGAPPHDLAAPVDVVLEDLLEGQCLGLAIHQRHHVGVEGQP
jgi:hypothetical protein